MIESTLILIVSGGFSPRKQPCAALAHDSNMKSTVLCDNRFHKTDRTLTRPTSNILLKSAEPVKASSYLTSSGAFVHTGLKEQHLGGSRSRSRDETQEVAPTRLLCALRQADWTNLSLRFETELAAEAHVLRSLIYRNLREVQK